MVIISDCLKDMADEGCRKLSKNLVKRLKKTDSETFIISYKQETELSDIHMKLNRLFLNPALFSIIKKKKGAVLYIPFASNTLPTAIRLYILSIFLKKDIYVIFNIRFSMNWLNRYFLEKSKASVIALSRESRDFYQGILKNPCYYLKTGIDLCKFHPVDEERKRFLREKYGFSKDRKLILHVGHLKRARNILSICEIDPKYQICLVVSSSTEKEEDVRAALKEYKNIRLIEEYIPEIQEYYQMADVYFFPVWQTENCIDIPLSVLEAGACNLPIVTTDYGELKEFAGKEGFYFLSSFEKEHLDQRLSEACQSRPGEAQLQEISAYDWESSIQVLMEILTQKKGG